MWPFTKKSYEQVNDPVNNALLKALFEFTAKSGTANVMADNPTDYLKQGYSGNADVYSIINRINRMASQARLALYRIEAGKWVEVTDHELNAFEVMVNPTMKTADFIQGHLIYKLSCGNSFWYKPTLQVGVNKGKTIELWLLPANNMEILASNTWTDPIAGYRLNTNQHVTFDKVDVYHSKFFNPLFAETASLWGQSPLKAAAETVSKQNQAEITELKQFQNQSPPYALYRKAKTMMERLGPEQRKEIADIMKDATKSANKGKPVVFPDEFGKLDFGISPVDLGILSSSQEGRRVLCNIYGFPTELLNDKAGSTYNNIVEAKKDAWNNCIIPNLNDFAMDLNAFIVNPIPEYKGLFFAFDYSAVAELQKDLATQVVWMKSAYWTPNEIREATGAKPIDDPAMGEPWFGMAESPLSAVTEPPPDLIIPNKGDYK